MHLRPRPGPARQALSRCAERQAASVADSGSRDAGSRQGPARRQRGAQISKQAGSALNQSPLAGRSRSRVGRQTPQQKMELHDLQLERHRHTISEGTYLPPKEQHVGGRKSGEQKGRQV
jgi:hypothetical protein